MECEISTITSDDTIILKILKETKTVAIVGLSPDENKDSNKVAKYLQNAGYKIVPIYPKEDTILGEKVYRSLEEIDIDIDLVNVFRKPAFVDTIVDMAIKKGGIKTIWTQLNIVNNSAGDRAINAGIKMVQNRCTKIEHMRLF
jgi:predicted CoA-binding protein